MVALFIFSLRLDPRSPRSESITTLSTILGLNGWHVIGMWDGQVQVGHDRKGLEPQT